jgi:hypothetical protein
MTERHPTSLQCWPGGKTLYYSGDPHGPDLRTHNGYDDTEGTPASAEDAKAIRIELRAKQYLDDEILCCDSALVDELLSNSFDGFTWDEVENLCVDPSDWDLEQCSEWLEDNGATCEPPVPNPFAMSLDELLEAIDCTDEDLKAEHTIESAKSRLIEMIDDGDIDGLDDWRNAVRDNAEDAEDAEVFQWFRVTPWFCEQLREIGEVVLDNVYGAWFGRQCCGQTLIMDGTLQRVAANQED